MVGWGGGGGGGAVKTRSRGKPPPPPPPGPTCYRQDTPSPLPPFSFFSPATFSLINCDEGENKAF